jgi:hypothetical protein
MLRFFDYDNKLSGSINARDSLSKRTTIGPTFRNKVHYGIMGNTRVSENTVTRKLDLKRRKGQKI